MKIRDKLPARQDLQPARTVRELEQKYPLGSIRKALSLAQSLEAELHSQAFLDAIVEAVLLRLSPEASPVTLYDLGDNTEATGGWELTTLAGYSLIQSSYHDVVNIKAQNGGSGWYLTQNAVDVTGLEKLTYACGMGGSGTARVVLVQEGSVVAQAPITVSTTTPSTRQELDISAVKGKCRIGLMLETLSGNILNAYMSYLALA